MRDTSATPESRLPQPKQHATRHLPLALHVLLAVLLPGCFIPLAVAQTESATVAGRVSDASGAVVPNAVLRLVNIDRGTETDTRTNGSGLYVIPGVVPGRYRIQVERDGFKVANLTGLTVNVQDNLEENFKLEVGSVSESVTVSAEGNNINTTDASVSTVVDRKFVESMPLNGRSFQSLILLAPGVVTNTPQSSARTGQAGEFSINGQRTDANYYTVDGVSANNAAFSGTISRAGNSGGLPSATALGSTQALVSIDALQEFRINTSTSSAEYGRQPGGQIQFETRSGTNAFHGTAFDYLRNTVFDANNWFNDYATPPVSKPAERQNDFGGVLGGPLSIPKLYSGKDRTYFFFSYEGLRLSQPEPATVSYVPTENFRQAAPTAFQPLLGAFPLPNCSVAQDPQCIDDSVEGLAPYLVSTSLPSSIDSISVRGDYVAAPWLRLFVRYGDTTSSAVQSVTTYESSSNYGIRSYTLGADATFLDTLSNQFRFNYSPTYGISASETTPLGGGTPANLQGLQGLDNIGETDLYLLFTNEDALLSQYHYGTPQHQWNLNDTVERLLGRHALRAGIDYRRTTSHLEAGSLTDSPTIEYLYFSTASALSNNVDDAFVGIASRQDPAFTNFSVFVQDEWKVKSRLSLSLGARWELNPAPTVVSGVKTYALNGNFDNPTSLSLAPLGTPLYGATYYNFAPRLGIAATLHDPPGHETVLRAGGGVYYDTGQQLAGLFGGGYSPGTGIQANYGAGFGTPVSFPLPLGLINIPTSESQIPPYGFIRTVSRHLQLPYTYQWNASLEQAIGAEQSVTIGYVGSNGRRLIELQDFELAAVNPLFTEVEKYDNGLSSSYNALQVQYKRRLSQGLQALASYTWSHALDFESQDASVLPYQRGNSDFDMRSNFTAALSYDVPGSYPDSWKRALFSRWGFDLRLTARTAFPIEINGPELTDPANGSEYFGLLNYDSSVPLYLYGSQYPGGRRINPAAFSAPAAGRQGNAPRNFVRGFGEDEANLAIRREFPVYEQVHLLFRAEAFNILNHPSFGAIKVTCGNPAAGETCTNLTFGRATSTLASSLGGLTPIYQQGGPRSLQFALKLLF